MNDTLSGGKSSRFLTQLFTLFAMAVLSLPAIAQEPAQDERPIDEIVTTGTQIKGAKISDALAVSVIEADAIELIGVESGDELLDSIPEMGQNTFSETDTAGGVNAARGDVGAINMRNLGTGNTLVLLNGRRLVNMATYQTEEVGGSFVPVNSVNSNHIPVFGVERVEVLRDGASAIYGADAVAGVMNTILKDDFEGFTIRARYSDFQNLPRNDESIALEWGESFNGGATHVGVFARHYTRDRVNTLDDPRWSTSDFRSRFPARSTYATNTQFRNDSSQSIYGQFEISPRVPSSNSLRQNEVVDGQSEFEIFPIGDSRCLNTDPDATAEVYDLGYGTCLHEDGQGVIRYDYNAWGPGRDLLSDLERTTVYGYLNHELDSGLEIFGDFYWYSSSTNRIRFNTADLSAVPLFVGGSNYYNPLGAVGSPNRLPDSIVGPDLPAEGYNLRMDNYRFAEYPRIVDNDGESVRGLAGLRGSFGDWDWETAAVYSYAERDDITHNRLSNTTLTLALSDPTPAAYNPFSGGVNTNIEPLLIDVYRKGRTTLGMWDFKISNPEIFNLPAGPVGFVAGYEFRRETYVDDRDPRLDGTIRFERDTDGDGVVDVEGDFDECDLDTIDVGCSADGFDTYPLTSDVVGSSPTPDGKGSRKTNSLFAELQIPIFETLDLQLAARYEDFDDIGDTTVGKVAFGWRPMDQVLFRGSWSEAFRAPNLITINEQFVARSNTLNDWVCFYGADQGGVDEDDCRYGIQRQATGSKALVPEESTNQSLGVVLTPVEGLTLTYDYWTIEKDGTIGLFGEENHILYDLVLRLQAGTADCANVQGNPDVVRLPFDPGLEDDYLDAGLCPVGEVDYVSDRYTNLDTRTVEGYDVGFYYDIDTELGSFSFRYNGAHYKKFEQTASSPLALAILSAQASDSTIVYPVVGLGDLLGIDGYQKKRQSASLLWRGEKWGAGITGYKISGFAQILSSGDPWRIPAMGTYNIKVDYSFDLFDVDTRLQLGINNAADKRAPLADDAFGIFKDAHRDWGRYYYLDLRMRFGT